jgi:hypothetical protein
MHSEKGGVPAGQNLPIFLCKVRGIGRRLELMRLKIRDSKEMELLKSTQYVEIVETDRWLCPL